MNRLNMDFNKARQLSRMTLEEISIYLELSPRTIYNYKKTGKAPKAIIECLYMIGGRCPTFSRRNDFSSWSFGQGFLWSPEGDKFTSGDIRAGKIALLEMNRIHRESVRSRQAEKALSLVVPDNIIQFPILIKKARISNQ